MLKLFLPVLICLFFFSAADAQLKNAKVFYRSGIEYKNKSQFPEALAAFEKSISLYKNFDSAYVEAGNIYSRSGNTDNGILYYKKALAVNPKYTDALIGMGRTYRDAKKMLDSAIFFYDAALKLDSTNKETYYALAWTYNAKKEHDKAIIYGIKSLELDNNYRPAYGELGYAYRSTQRFADAIEQFKKNLSVSVIDVAYLYIGYCYIELKNKDGALQQYEELNKINEKMAAALKKKIDAME